MSRPLAAAFAAVALCAGCSLDDSGFKAGELGNGGFYFSCDDAVACGRYSNDASKFPKSVSQGSSFTVRFEPRSNSSGLEIHFDDKQPNRGIIIEPVSDFVTRGPNGLTAIKPGFSSLVARDSKGFVIDYVVVRVARPDALVVYAADGARTDPPRVDKVELTRGQDRSYRAFAQQNKEDLAGSLQIEWKSSDTTVFQVQSTTGGEAKIVARAAGNAKLIATGGTFVQEVPVEVKP